MSTKPVCKCGSELVCATTVCEFIRDVNLNLLRIAKKITQKLCDLQDTRIDPIQGIVSQLLELNIQVHHELKRLIEHPIREANANVTCTVK